MKNIETSHKLQQQADLMIWDRLKRAHSQMSIGRRYEQQQKRIQAAVKPIEKQKDKVLIDFAAHYHTDLSHKFLTSRTPFENNVIDEELKPLTARIKNSYFNIATMDQLEYIRKIKDINDYRSDQRTQKMDVEQSLQHCDSVLIQKFLKKKFSKLNKRTLISQPQNKKASKKNDLMSTIQRRSISQTSLYVGNKSSLRLQEEGRKLFDENAVVSRKTIIKQNQFLLKQLKRQLDQKQPQLLHRKEKTSRNITLAPLLSQQQQNPSVEEDNPNKKWLSIVREQSTLGQQLQFYFQTVDGPLNRGEQLSGGFNTQRKHQDQHDCVPKPKYVTVLDKHKYKVKALDKKPKYEYLKKMKSMSKAENDISDDLDSLKKEKNLPMLRYNTKKQILEEVPVESIQNQRRQSLKKCNKQEPPPEKKESLEGSSIISQQLFKYRLQRGFLKKLGLTLEQNIEQKQAVQTIQNSPIRRAISRKVSSNTMVDLIPHEDCQKYQEHGFNMSPTRQLSTVNEYKTMMSNLITNEQSSLRKTDLESADQKVPMFMRNAIKSKLEEVKVSIMKGNIDLMLEKLHQKASHFEILNAVCSVIDKCEKNKDSNLNNEEDSSARLIHKADAMQIVNERVEQQMILMINKKLEERKYQQLITDMNFK